MKAKEVIKLLGITSRTLNNYVNNNIVRFHKINHKHYIYNDEDVYNLLGKSKENFEKRINIIYSRVSLNKQKNDLISQTKRLSDFSISKGVIIDKIISDVKSGMNFNDRKGFNELIDLVIENKIDSVIIENKDRLVRFGFDMIENLFLKYNTKIIISSNVEDKSYEQELTEDLLSIIHYFSMKSYSNRRKLNKMKQLLKTESEEK